MPILQTGRLLLRPWSGNDLNSYAQMMAHPEVVRFLGHDPLDRAEAWRNLALLIGHDVLRGFTLNAVVDKATDRVVGRCGLWCPEGWPGLEVGWALDPEVWGRGFATEAAAAWRYYAFEVLGADEIVSIVHELNVRSAAVAQRIGQSFVRRFQFRGHPCHLYGQRRPDW